MNFIIKVVDIFNLSNGVTILACETTTDIDWENKIVSIHSSVDSRNQTIRLIGRRKLLNQSIANETIALETCDRLLFSSQDAKNGVLTLTIEKAD